ncbi:hypothetical protein Vretifemale_12775 [Volvox reticuliferus]|uniref:Uncharacterized protein n=2 Tax=Volvox reticuliferus TaxID=1737510 RepID=A0A8J4CJ29_9CHLO|nr:hypothetical protein Vretifemale_12775 [Volvox reticuliferus]
MYCSCLADRGRNLPNSVPEQVFHMKLPYYSASPLCEHSGSSSAGAVSAGVPPSSAAQTGNGEVALPAPPPDTLRTLALKHRNMVHNDMASFGSLRGNAHVQALKTPPSELLTMRVSGIQQAATGNRSEATILHTSTTDTRSPSAIITTASAATANPKALSTEMHLGRNDSLCQPGLYPPPSDRTHGGSSPGSPGSNAHAAIITHSGVELRPAKYLQLTGVVPVASNQLRTGSPSPLIPTISPAPLLPPVPLPLPPITTGVPSMYLQSNPPMWVSTLWDPSGKYPPQIVNSAPAPAPAPAPALLNIGLLCVGGGGGDGGGGSCSGRGGVNGSGGGDAGDGNGSSGNVIIGSMRAGVGSGGGDGAAVAANSGGGRSPVPRYLHEGTMGGRPMKAGPTCGTALAKIIAAVLAENLIVPSVADGITLPATATAGSGAAQGPEAAITDATLPHEATGASVAAIPVVHAAPAPARVAPTAPARVAPAAPAVAPARVAAVPAAGGGSYGGDTNSVAVRLDDQGRGGGGNGSGGNGGTYNGSGGGCGNQQVEVAVQASVRNDCSKAASCGHGCEYGGGGAGGEAPLDAGLMAMATDLAAHGRELVSRLVRVQATRRRLVQLEEVLTGQILQARHMLLSVLDQQQQQQQLIQQLSAQRSEQQPRQTLMQRPLQLQTQPPPPPPQQQQQQQQDQQQQKRQPQQQQQGDEDLPKSSTQLQLKQSQSPELRCQNQVRQVLKRWRGEDQQLTAATAASMMEGAVAAGSAKRALLQPSSEPTATGKMEEDLATTMPIHGIYIPQPTTRPLATTAAVTSGLPVARRSSSGGPVVSPPQRVHREQQQQMGAIPEGQQLQLPHNAMWQLRQPAEQQYLPQPKQQQQSAAGQQKRQRHPPMKLEDGWRQPQQQEDDFQLSVDCKGLEVYRADEQQKSTEAAESLIQLCQVLPLPQLEPQQQPAAPSSRDVLQPQPRPQLLPSSPPQPQQRQQKSRWSSLSSRRSQQPQQPLSSALFSLAGPDAGTQRSPLLPQVTYHNRQRQQQPRQQLQQRQPQQCPHQPVSLTAASAHQPAPSPAAATAAAAAHLHTNPIFGGDGSPGNCRPCWATRETFPVIAAGKTDPLCDDVNDDDVLLRGGSTGSAGARIEAVGAVAAGPSCAGASDGKWAANSNEAGGLDDASVVPSIARAAVGPEGAADGNYCSSAGLSAAGDVCSGLIACIPTQPHQGPCRMTQQPAAAAFQVIQLARQLMMTQGQQQRRVTAAARPAPSAPPVAAPVASYITVNGEQRQQQQHSKQQQSKLQRREQRQDLHQQVASAVRNDDQLAATSNTAGDAAIVAGDSNRHAAGAATSPVIAAAAGSGPAATAAPPEGVGGSIIRTAGPTVRVSSLSHLAALHPGWSSWQQQQANPTADLLSQPSLPPQMAQQHEQPQHQQLLDQQRSQRLEQQLLQLCQQQQRQAPQASSSPPSGLQHQQQLMLGPGGTPMPRATQLPGVTHLPPSHGGVPSTAMMAPRAIDSSGSSLSPCRKRSRVMGAYF